VDIDIKQTKHRRAEEKAARHKKGRSYSCHRRTAVYLVDDDERARARDSDVPSNHSFILACLLLRLQSTPISSRHSSSGQEQTRTLRPIESQCLSGSHANQQLRSQVVYQQRHSPLPASTQSEHGACTAMHKTGHEQD